MKLFGNPSMQLCKRYFEHGNAHDVFSRCRQDLDILSQAPVISQPREVALDNPPFGQNSKPIHYLGRDMTHQAQCGNCWDNAPTERFFKSLKTEWVPEIGYPAFEAAKQTVMEYIIDYYSSLRPHRHNDGLPPNELEKKCWNAQKSVTKNT